VALLDSDMEDAVDDLLAGGPGAAAAAADGGGAAGIDAGADRSGSEEAEQPAAEPLSEADYDAMVAAAVQPRSGGGRGRGSDAEEDETSSSDLEGDDEEAGQVEEARELLPTEDDFLRLADMEAFVQQAEVAEEAGDRGGLETFDEIEARRAEGLDEGELGASTSQRRQRSAVKRGRAAGGGAGDEEGSGQDAVGSGDADDDSGSDIDLFGGGESDGDNDLADDDGEGGAGDGITYESFFGRKAPLGSRLRGKTIAPKRGAPARGATTFAEASMSDDDDEGDADASSDGLDEEAAAGHGFEEASDSDADMDAAQGGRLAQRRGGAAGAAAAGVAGADAGELSTHQKRMLRLREQIAEMEEAAMTGAAWHMRGEASAASRPIESALEIDLDFEQTLRPPPAPTMEAATALEDIIKARIRELRFDNVVRVEPAAPRKERAALELDDSKSRAGLADLYEEGGAERAGGAAAGQRERVRMVRALRLLHCAWHGLQCFRCDARLLGTCAVCCCVTCTSFTDCIPKRSLQLEVYE
jgi:U3 small nucleolar RNA-associated protein MPP10